MWRELQRNALAGKRNEWTRWKWQIRNRITSADELSQVVRLGKGERGEIRKTVEKTGRKMSITPYTALIIYPEKPLDDPIGKTLIPTKEFMRIHKNQSWDPYGIYNHKNNIYVDESAGITHKYPPTLHVKVTYTCFYGCQHCYQTGPVLGLENSPKLKNSMDVRIGKVVAYLKDNPGVYDVLLTGGDPLFLSDDQIANVLARIQEVPTVHTIRFGTNAVFRMPMRITDAFVEKVMEFRDRFDIRFVLNMIHPNEFTDEAISAIKKLKHAGFFMYSLTPLLRGVNLERETIAGLINKMIRHGIAPYYFIVKHPVPGTAHFAMRVEKIRDIFKPFMQHSELSGLGLAGRLMVPAPEQKVYLYPEMTMGYDEKTHTYTFDVDEKPIEFKADV